MEERWLVSIAPKKSDSGIYLSKIELFILRLPYVGVRYSGPYLVPKSVVHSVTVAKTLYAYTLQYYSVKAQQYNGIRG